MRSAIFFFVVFTVMIMALYLLVETREQPVFDDPPMEVEPTDTATKNLFELPVMDPEKGRLLWTIKGELPDGHYEVGGIQDPKNLALRNGVLEIPVYDDIAEGFPKGIRKINKVELTFGDMKYEASEGSRPSSKRTEETIQLFGGGEGRADDGTRITFEDLEVKIRKNPSFVRLSSSKKISIVNDLLEMRSPSGMEAIIRGGSEIERVTFAPPVVAFVDSKSAQLFSLDAPEVEESVLIAITSSGPLELDRTTTPPRIRFQDDVKIFPLDESRDKTNPLPGDTWFHCQELSLLMRREEGQPAQLSEAIASWSGGRVKAAYEGILLDGEFLKWKRLSPAADTPEELVSEAILTGRPQLEGEDLTLSAESAIFHLHERRVRLQHDVSGVLRQSLSVAENEDDEDRADTRYLPETWNFETDDFVDILFASDEKSSDAGSGDGAKTRDSKRTRPGAPSQIEQLVAESTRGDGLVLQGEGKETVSLQGRRFVYDGKSSRVSVVGGPDKDPTFRHGKSMGSAKKLVLMLEDRFVRFETDVVLAIDEKEVREFRESRKRKKTGDQKGLIDEEAFESGVELRGDRFDVSYDSNQQVRTVVAQGHPVSIVPINKAVQYALRGPNITWDHGQSIAFMEAIEQASAGAEVTQPTIDFGDGTTTASRIRFDRKTWTAELEGKVELRHAGDRLDVSDEPAKVTQTARPDSFALRAGKAKIQFFEWFEALAPDDRCVEDSLRRIRHVHASAGPDKKIDVQGSEYSASASELDWDVAVQKLRLHGSGQQEFRRIVGDRLDTVRAAEVVYDRAARVIRFERDVSGEFHLNAASLDGEFGKPVRASVRSNGPPPAGRFQSSSGDESESVLWNYRTDVVELHVKDGPGCSGLELVKLRAHGKVVLNCLAKRVKLLGDEFTYNHDTRELRMFSESGRPQTLVHEPVASSGDPKVNKIDAREIRLSYSGEGLAGQDERPRYVIVDFDKDVSASFHASSGSAAKKSGQVGDEWKLRADSLRVEIEKDVRRVIAEGEVIFTSDEMQAIAPSARYEMTGRDGKLTLRGSASSPVRVQHEGGTVSEKEIVITMSDGRFSFHLPSARRR